MQSKKFIFMSLFLMKEMRRVENFRKKKKNTFHIFLRLYSFSTPNASGTDW